LGKPSDYNEAVKMLEKLSANAHQVYTGVCIRSVHNERCFHARTDVHFRRLKKDEIEYYVENYKPYDKAGAYGIQEWIGYVGVSRIEGSYYNVMGLPLMQVYQYLRDFVEA